VTQKSNRCGPKTRRFVSFSRFVALLSVRARLIRTSSHVGRSLPVAQALISPPCRNRRKVFRVPRPRAWRRPRTTAHSPSSVPAEGGPDRLELEPYHVIYGLARFRRPQNGTLATPGAFKQLQKRRPVTCAASDSFDIAVPSLRRLRPVTVIWHIRAQDTTGRSNGVLVDHLTHAVSEQDDELVERIDLTL